MIGDPHFSIPFVTLAATCLIGQGHACCRYIVGNANGFYCAKKTTLKAALDNKVMRGEMVAQGDNCPGLPQDDA